MFRILLPCLSAGLLVADNTRSKLLNLLAEIDAKENLQELPDEIGSLLEAQHMRRTARNSWEPPRRRGGHSPCECPDTPGDQLTTECLNRRYGFVNGNLERIQTPNATTGFSIEGGRIALRHAYSEVITLGKSIENTTNELETNLTDQTTGYVHRTDRNTQQLLNEETLMVESANNAWMSTVNVSNKVVFGANSLGRKLTDTASSLLTWFNRMQNDEEAATFKNLKQAARIAQNSLNVYVQDINQAVSTVFGALAQLDSSIGGSESSSHSLGDALESAADSLAGQVETFNQTVSDLEQPTSDAIQQALTGLINQYEKVAKQQVASLQSSASLKIADMRKESLNQIKDQEKTMATSLTTARTAAVSQGAEVVKSQAALTAGIQADLQNLTEYIDSERQRFTASLQDSVSKHLSNISWVNNSVSTISGEVGTFSSTEKKTFTSSQTANQGYGNSATKKISSLYSQATGKMNENTKNAQNIAAGSVTAVGTSLQSNMQSMGQNTQDIVSSLTSSSGSTARDSANAENGLSNVANNAQQVMTNAGQDVLENYQKTFGDILSEMGPISSQLGGSSGDISSILNSFLNEAGSGLSDAGDLVSGAVADGVGNAASQLGDTEVEIQALASNMNQVAPFAQERIGQIKERLTSASAISAGASSNAFAVSESGSRAMSAAANQIASAEEIAVKNLQARVSQLLHARGNFVNGTVGSGLTKSLSAAVSLVESAQTSIDSSTKAALEGGSSSSGALSDASDTISGASNAAQSNSQQSAATVSGGTDSALAEVDKLLASSNEGTSEFVTNQLSEIKEMQKAASLQVGQLSESRLSEIEAVSASVDTLMQQVNAYLGHNSAPLASDISGLAVEAKRLLLKLTALEDEANGVDAQATSAEGGSDMVSALQGILVSHNSSSIDQLSEIASYLNQSADNVGATTQSEISDAITDFSNAASGLESELNGLHFESSAHAPVEGAQKMIGMISDLSSGLTSVSQRSSSTLTKMPSSSPSAGEIGSLYGLVTLGTQAAEVDSQFASSMLDKLAAQAKDKINAASQFSQTEGFVNPGEVQQQTSLATINENVANTKLHQQQSFLDALSGASTNLSKDYEAQVRASKSVASQNATNVYNRVVEGKAKVSQMVGNIAAEYAAEQSEASAGEAVSSAQQKLDIASMRRNLENLIRVFDTFTGAANHSFDTGAGDMDNFGVATLAGLKRQLSEFEQQLLDDGQKINSNISTLNATFQSYSASEIDAQTEATAAQFDDWMQAQISAVDASGSSLSGLGPGAPMDASTLEIRTNATVNSLALAAQTLLAQYDIDLPRLDKILAQTSTSTGTDSGETIAPAQSTDSGTTAPTEGLTDAGTTSPTEGLTDSGTTAPTGESTDLGTTVAPVESTDSGTTVAPVESTDSGTTVAPVESTDSGTTVAPAQPTDSGTTVAQVESTDSGTTVAHAQPTDSGTTAPTGESTDLGTTVAPVESADAGTTVAPVESTDSGTTVAPTESTDSGTTVAPAQPTDAGTTAAPVASTDSGTAVAPAQSTDAESTAPPEGSTAPTGESTDAGSTAVPGEATA